MIEVKTAEFKNHLSRYLHLVREAGEVIIVFDRNLPVAKVIPYENPSEKPPSIWKLRDVDESRYGVWEDDFDIPGRLIYDDTYKNPLEG